MIRTKTVVLQPLGADGSAAASYRLSTGRPGIIRMFSVDYTSQAATTDITVRADDSAGAVLLTLANQATDLAARPVGMPGVDETGAAVAATDASSGGLPYTSGIHVAVAQADNSPTGNKNIVIKFWIES